MYRETCSASHVSRFVTASLQLEGLANLASSNLLSFPLCIFTLKSSNIRPNFEMGDQQSKSAMPGSSSMPPPPSDEATRNYSNRMEKLLFAIHWYRYHNVSHSDFNNLIIDPAVNRKSAEYRKRVRFLKQRQQKWEDESLRFIKDGFVRLIDLVSMGVWRLLSKDQKNHVYSAMYERDAEGVFRGMHNYACRCVDICWMFRRDNPEIDAEAKKMWKDYGLQLFMYMCEAMDEHIIGKPVNEQNGEAVVTAWKAFPHLEHIKALLCQRGVEDVPIPAARYSETLDD